MTKSTLFSSPGSGNPGTFRSIPPVQVRWALWLLWLSLAINFGLNLRALYFMYLSGFLPTTFAGNRPLIVAHSVPFLLEIVSAFLYVKIGQQKNWARITALLFSISGVVRVVVFSQFLQGIGYYIAGIVPALELAALFLLFANPGRLWFRHGPAAAEV